MEGLVIAEWLRELCDQAGFSQTEMAERMGITLSVYSKLVTDKTPFRPAYFFAACEATNRRPEEEKERIKDFRQFSPFRLKNALSNFSPKGETLIRLNLKRSLISNCKRGSVPSADKLQSIAQALLVTPESLCDSFKKMLGKYRNNWREHLQLSETKGTRQKTVSSPKRRLPNQLQRDTATGHQGTRSKPKASTRQGSGERMVVIALKRKTYELFAAALLASNEGRDIPIFEL
jgi:transcriptional regulator with XRE-family HTH domain